MRTRAIRTHWNFCKILRTTNSSTDLRPRSICGAACRTFGKPGARRYTGWSQHAEDFIEPHVVGEDGYAYLRLYEMTGNTKYLRAVIRCAEALVKNPHFRCN
jgi:hypothetical protein